MIFNDGGIFGFDVSFYQDDNQTPEQIDFEKMKNYGASFVIPKVGQRSYLDPDFTYNWRAAKEAGLPRSAYWFCDIYMSGAEQARLFWEAVKEDPPEGILFADFEGGSWTHWTQLYNFLSELKTISGLPSEKIGIYTAYYYWVEFGPRTLAQKQWFSQFPLWLAWYTDDVSIVKVPDTWRECLLWQKGTPAIGEEVGVESREIDYNIFNGDLEKLERFLGTPPVIEPPDNGEEMILYLADLKDGFTSNVRSDVGTENTVTRQIVGPLTVEIDSEKSVEDNYDWYHIVSPVSGYIALTTSYENFRPATVSSGQMLPVLTITLEGEGYPTQVIEWHPLNSQ